VGTATAGEVTATLPKGSSFVSAAAGCSLTTAPGPTSTGLVTCAMPALVLGGQASQTVTFAMPPDAPGEHGPANFRLLGSYRSSGLTLIDGDEVNALNTNLEAATIKLDASFTSSPLEVGTPETIEMEIKSTTGGLDEPTVRFELARATFSAIEISGQPIECSAPSANIRDCILPSGISSTKVKLTVIPSATSLELKTTAQALNAPPATLGIGFIG
jgi:hypothetical protein